MRKKTKTSTANAATPNIFAPADHGGTSNTVSGAGAYVGGGEQNTASGAASTIGAGTTNTASGSYSTIGGGYSNTATVTRATVAGGSANAATGQWSTLGGGNLNKATDDYGVVAGGTNNTAADYLYILRRGLRRAERTRNSFGTPEWVRASARDLRSPGASARRERPEQAAQSSRYPRQGSKRSGVRVTRHSRAGPELGGAENAARSSQVVGIRAAGGCLCSRPASGAGLPRSEPV